MVMKTKSFKKLSSAIEYAKLNNLTQAPAIIRVGDLYIAGVHSSTSIALLTAHGEYAGSITPTHLERLGNACHALPKHGMGYKHEVIFDGSYRGGETAETPEEMRTRQSKEALQSAVS